MEVLYLFAIAAYVAVLWVTGFIVTRKSRSSEAYLLASRNLSVPLISVLIAGTWIGGVSVVGMAQGAYLHGIGALWFQVGIWVAMFVTALLLPRIAKGKKTYSIVDVVAGLYGRGTGRLAGLLQLVFSVWTVTMQIVGGGAVLSYILKGRLSFGEGMVLTALVFTLYNVMGGFVATAYTNLIHISVIVTGLSLGGFYVFFAHEALSRMVHEGHYFQPFGDLGVIHALSWAYINFTLAVLAQPVINIASSAAGVRQGRSGVVIGNIIAIPVVAVAALCGIASRFIFPDIPSLSALPALLDVMPPVVAVFFLLAMWAPLMSSGSPFLMGATTLAVKGYVAPVLGIGNDRKLLVASRFTTLAIGFVSLLLGFFVKEILREITWLAVFLSAIVYIVFLGWSGVRIAGFYASVSLLGTIFVVFLSFVTGFFRIIHPIWPVTVFVFVVMGIGRFASGRHRMV